MPSDEELEPVRLPIEDVFDLHPFAPKDAKAALEAYLEEAHRTGLRALRIIHGRGIGVQREMVRKVLQRTPFVVSIQDAPPEAGGWGATLVTLGDMTSGSSKTQEKTDDLEKLTREYDAALADAEDLVKGLSSGQFNWRPGRRKWSIGQCLDHLVIIDGLYTVRLTAMIDEAHKQKWLASGPFRYSAVQSYFLRVTEPPPRFKVRAPTGVTPRSAPYEPSITMEEFRKGNRALRKLVGQAKGVDLAAVKVASPIFSFWKWSIGIVLPLCVAHERRHLYQARQVRQSTGFPAGLGVDVY